MDKDVALRFVASVIPEEMFLRDKSTHEFLSGTEFLST